MAGNHSKSHVFFSKIGHWNACFKDVQNILDRMEFWPKTWLAVLNSNLQSSCRSPICSKTPNTPLLFERRVSLESRRATRNPEVNIYIYHIGYQWDVDDKDIPMSHGGLPWLLYFKFVCFLRGKTPNNKFYNESMVIKPVKSKYVLFGCSNYISGGFLLGEDEPNLTAMHIFQTGWWKTTN